MPAVVDDAPLSVPLELPAAIDDVKVTRGGQTSASSALHISADGVSWSNGDGTLGAGDIVLHGLVTDEEPRCVYAQLEDGTEVRFAGGNLVNIYRALSALAIVAEEAVRAAEAAAGEGAGAGGSDAFYTRRADGSVGAVSIDALLADESLQRYDDAEDLGGGGGGDADAAGNGAGQGDEPNVQ